MNVVVVGGHAALWIWLRKRNERRFRNKKSDQVSTSLAPTHLDFADAIARLSTSLPDFHPNPILPAPLNSSPSSFIDDPETLTAVAARLALAPRLAVDIEHHSTHTYYGQSCLIQLSDGCEDFIIDAIALRSVIKSTLGPLFSNPSILKVLHGGGSDVLWLRRDFEIFCINILDTEKCCQVLHYPPQHRSLKFLLNKFVGVEVDKTLQMADWRQRPLTPEMVEYARSDVHYLLYIADCLGKELGCSVDGGGENSKKIIEDNESPLGRAIHRSQSLSLVEYTPPLARVAASAAAAAIMKNHIAALRQNNSNSNGSSSENEKIPSSMGQLAPFDDEQLKQITDLSVRVHALCTWRDAEARKIDEGVTCVLPDDVLLHVAQQHVVKKVENVKDLQLLLHSMHTKNGINNSENKNKYARFCKFPEVAVANAGSLLTELHAAGAGQRPWAHPDVLAAMKAPSLAALDTAAKRRHEDPEVFKERLGEKFGVKKEVYENCRMLSKSGEMLCFTDKKRLLWYIRKGLAVEVEPGKEPLTVQLTFEHRDDDQRAGAHEFYSSKRSNTCVACGAGKHYLRYRVVPICYRKALPEKFKSHRSHDVLLLCIGCHEIAQRASEKMKREVSAEYGVPLFPRFAATNSASAAANEEEEEKGNGTDSRDADQNGEGTASTANGTATTNGNGTSKESSSKTTLNPESLHPFSVRKAAVALDRSDAATFPAWRRQELQQLVSIYTRTVEPWLQNVPSDAPFTQDELWAGLLAGMSKPTRRKAIRRWIAQGRENALPTALLQELDTSGTEGCNSGVDVRDGMGHSWHGQLVVETAYKQGGDDALSQLCALFRQAFIDALNPKYLPAGWKVEHTAPRTFGEHSIYHEDEDKCVDDTEEEEEGNPNGDAHVNGNSQQVALPEAL
jgi:cation-transporting P-type ATPase D